MAACEAREFEQAAEQDARLCSHIGGFVTEWIDNNSCPSTDREREEMAEQIAHDYWERHPAKANQFDKLINNLCGDTADRDDDQNIVLIRLGPSVVLETYIEWVIVNSA